MFSILNNIQDDLQDLGGVNKSNDIAYYVSRINDSVESVKSAYHEELESNETQVNQLKQKVAALEAQKLELTQKLKVLDYTPDHIRYKPERMNELPDPSHFFVKNFWSFSSSPEVINALDLSKRDIDVIYTILRYKPEFVLGINQFKIEEWFLLYQMSLSMFTMIARRKEFVDLTKTEKEYLLFIQTNCVGPVKNKRYDVLLDYVKTLNFRRFCEDYKKELNGAKEKTAIKDMFLSEEQVRIHAIGR
jgi:uncharacterized protein YeaO (DUF488 family)